MVQEAEEVSLQVRVVDSTVRKRLWDKMVSSRRKKQHGDSETAELSVHPVPTGLFFGKEHQSNTQTWWWECGDVRLNV